MPGRHYTQIDIMKGLSIISVMAMHTIDGRYLEAIAASFWIWQAVPVFMVLLGMNLALGLSGAGSATAAEVYTRRYLKSRCRRVLVPFLIAFGISAIIAAVGYSTQPGYHVNVGWLTLVGQFPAGGPGNYFFTALLQFAIIGPALWIVYKKSPVVTLFGSLLASVGFEYWAIHSSLVAAHPYVHDACILRFVPAIALGMWLADGWSLTSQRNAAVLVGAGASLVYLVYNSATGWTIPFVLPDVPTMSFASFAYAAMLIMLGMAVLPTDTVGFASRALARVGRQSYHIFLVQILWFSSLAAPVARLIAAGLSLQPCAPELTVVVFAVDATICITAGAFFFRVLAPRVHSA